MSHPWSLTPSLLAAIGTLPQQANPVTDTGFKTNLLYRLSPDRTEHRPQHKRAYESSFPASEFTGDAP
jgi:hypothetical protein